jgi:hypothetical protein
MLHVQPGDRIRLLTMTNDPAPIPAGEQGTVEEIVAHTTGHTTWHQIFVAWNCGRSLMLVSPPDEFEIISPRTATAAENVPQPTGSNRN